jgi:putative FmdB family regulatory protein
MPVYEFLCQDCEKEFEELVLRHDEVIRCPKCGSQRATKLLSSFAVTGSARLGGAACSSCTPSAGKCSGCGSH